MNTSEQVLQILKENGGIAEYNALGMKFFRDNNHQLVVDYASAIAELKEKNIVSSRVSKPGWPYSVTDLEILEVR